MTKSSGISPGIVPLLLLILVPARAAEFYVSPNGKPSATGAIDSPWDLATALKQPKSVKPADTIWLRGGTYQGEFTSSLNGAINAPIAVRQYPGEHAVIDGSTGQGLTLTVNGSWTWFWGFEVMSSTTTRLTTIAGSSPSDINQTGIAVFGPNTKLINLIVHDTASGIGFWTPAVDAELYGNIIFNNGWTGPDRGHGHAIYAQNDAGIKVIRENILFNQFDAGMHIYGSENAKLRNFRVQGNVTFDNGFLVGGGTPAENIELIENYFYGSTVQLYYAALQNKTLSLIRNFFAAPVAVFWWDHVTALGNTFFRNDGSATLDFRLASSGTLADHIFDRDIYPVATQGQLVIGITGGPYPTRKNLSFADMQQLGFERNGSLQVLPGGKPAKPDVFVRRNEYDPSLAHVIIYNWPHQNTVDVDLSTMNLQNGDQYELRNAQNYLAEAIKGTYAGRPISVPMIGWTIATPIGLDKSLNPSTFPNFGVFVLTVTPSSKLATGSAARYAEGNLAAGSIAATFGPNLAPADATPAHGASVTITDAAATQRPAVLFSISPTQANYLIPSETAVGPATVTVTGGTSAANEAITISATAPGLFAANGNGSGVAAASAVRVDVAGVQTQMPVFGCGQLPVACTPTPLDLGADSDQAVLTLYGTGIRNCSDWSSFYVLIGGQSADILYAGPHPTLAGLDQMNVRLSPALVGRSEVDVIVMLGDQVSNAVTINIQ